MRPGTSTAAVQFKLLREAQDGATGRAAKDQLCELLRAWSDGDTSALELNVDETADVLKVSPATVMRDWSTARSWLYRELAAGTRDGR